VKNRKEQQERTEICKDEFAKITEKRKDALRKRLNEEMRRKNTQR
jgi:hypothetical protein